MNEGTIKFTNVNEGYGFIITSNGDVHFRVRDCSCPVHQLRPGVPVTFDPSTNQQGKNAAVNVSVSPDYQVDSLEATGRIKFWDANRGLGYVEAQGLVDDVFIARWLTVFERGQEPATGDQVLISYVIDSQRSNPQGMSLDVTELAPWQSDPHTPLFNFADMGPRAQWVEELATLAEPENWDYRKSPTGDKPILDSYIRYTYLRLEEEQKISISTDESHAAFNTGLVTPMQEEIFAVFNRNLKAGRQPWQLFGFRKRSDRQFLQFFGRELPKLADYFTDPSVLLYDRRMPLYIGIDHVLENLERFPTTLRDNIFQARLAVQAAEEYTRQRVFRNYKAAIPQWYRNRTGGAEIQLLIPLCLQERNVADLALVVEREDGYYRGNTVLTLDMAYKNARLLARPDGEWLVP